MMKKGKHIIKSYMTLEYDFTGTRIQDAFLTPVDWKLTVNLVAAEKKGKTKEEIEHQASITYQKIYFWLDTNMPSILAVDVGKEDDLFIANLSSNIMLYCPGNPSDDLLIQLLHAKIATIAEPDLMVGQMTLKGSDTSLQYTFDCPDGDYSIPGTTEEYYTEGTTRDEVPWWFRDDGFCFEFVRPDDATISDEELFKDIVDPMDEFTRVVNEMADTSISMVREPARIVQVEKWKPKTV